MSEKVVLRFAPSPTGPLHIGGVRTALYNALFVKQKRGTLILRIEDTDQKRFVQGAEEHILESFKWLGIEFDEGPHKPGDRGPYRQSERAATGIYRPYADQLIAEGKAYYAFDTPEELEAMRDRLKEAGSSTQQYNYVTRNTMTNSLTLSEEEVKRRIDAGDSYVIRMKMPRKEEVRFHDIVRQWVVFHSSQLDDKVLMKSDGLPTYHLANVVDDHLMQITHVIRGEEWLSSTPLHVLLYRAFGWEETMPKFVHLPLILNPNGKGKLSKRQGDKMGFSVFPIAWADPEGDAVTGYREEGYLPEAMINFLALLGWNPGNDEELMDMARLIEIFSLERLQHAGMTFDIEKLKWFNQHYLRQRSDEELLPLVQKAVSAAGLPVESEAYLLQVIALMKERLHFPHELAEQGPYFFQTPTQYDAKMAKKRWNDESAELIGGLVTKFETVEWNAESLHHAFQELIEEKGVGNGKVLAPLRLALTGMSFGPGAFEIAELIGREETLLRLNKAIKEL